VGGTLPIKQIVTINPTPQQQKLAINKPMIVNLIPVVVLGLGIAFAVLVVVLGLGIALVVLVAVHL
jgi:hypothetical protein